MGVGAPFDSREYTVRFRPIQIVCLFFLGGGGGGGAVRFWPIQPMGGAHVCYLLLQGGGGGGDTHDNGM